MADLSDEIESAASAPAEMDIDGQRRKAHSLKDIIAADKYLAAKAASRNPRRLFRTIQLSPPGTQ